MTERSHPLPDDALPGTPSAARGSAVPEGVALAAPGAGALAAPAPAVRSSRAADLALVTTFAAFIAACAVLPAIPVPGLAVPLTLQTFAVVLTGLVLGPRRGAVAVALYLGVGLAGLPVFAGGAAGLAVLAGASAGYLLAFVPGAAVAGWLGRKAHRVRTSRKILALAGAATIATLAVVTPVGMAVMGWRLGLGPLETVVAGAVFIPGDLVKNVLAALVAAAVVRAFPDLVRR